MSMSRLKTCDELRRLEKFSDVIIKVENRTFPCHRIILSSTLEYFRNMFSGNYVEATQKEVEIKGVSADDFELVLTHIYGGSVDLSESNVYRLLRISDYVGLEELSTACQEYTINNKDKISLNILLDIFLFASKLVNTRLVDELARTLAHNFLSISKEEKLSLISRTEIEKIFSHLSIHENQMAILDFMDYWSGFHPTEVDVFDSWLLNSLPSNLGEWIKDKLKKNKISLTDEKKTDGKTGDDTLDTEEEPVFYKDCMDYDESSEVQPDEVLSPEISLYCHLSPYALGSYCRYDFDTKSNRIPIDGMVRFDDTYMDSFEIVFLKSVWTATGIHLLFPGHYINNSLQICPYICTHSTSLNKYLTFHSPPYTPIDSRSQIAACGDLIYLYNRRLFQIFNAELNKWTKLTGNEPYPRTKNANLISYQNNLYILGGQSIQHQTLPAPNQHRYTFDMFENGKIFQRYDPRAGKWSQLPYMSHRNGMPSSCVYKDVLYATGGENLSCVEGWVQCFDFKADKWRVLETRVPKPMKNPIVLGHNDLLYFISNDSDFTWYSYNLTKGSWSDVLEVPRNRSSFKIERILDAEVRV